jgi:4-hydroxy-3-polyprenylbenzoate decarboxylase
MRQDAAWHVRENDQQNKPTPVAVAIGADPSIESPNCRRRLMIAGAGALRGARVDLVCCETVPLEVPATAEIVLEGEIPPNALEHEGPFGEYTGYMGPASDQPFFNIKCMTFHDNPVYQAFISQLPRKEKQFPTTVKFVYISRIYTKSP